MTIHELIKALRSDEVMAYFDALEALATISLEVERLNAKRTEYDYETWRAYIDMARADRRDAVSVVRRLKETGQ
jgi:hypothetical protein